MEPPSYLGSLGIDKNPQPATMGMSDRRTLPGRERTTSMTWRLALAPFLAAAIVVVAAAGCARDEPADPPTPKAPATPVDPAAPTGTAAEPQAPKTPRPANTPLPPRAASKPPTPTATPTPDRVITIGHWGDQFPRPPRLAGGDGAGADAGHDGPLARRWRQQAVLHARLRHAVHAQREGRGRCPGSRRASPQTRT